MPDIGWMELLVIGVVALIVVGPKDLPVMFHRLGQFTGRIRGMARDFQRAMDDAARESGMEEVKRDLNSAAKFANPRKAGMDALNDALGDTLADIDPARYDEGSATRALAEEKAAARKSAREAVAAREPARPDAGQADMPAAVEAADRPAARAGADAP